MNASFQTYSRIKSQRVNGTGRVAAVEGPRDTAVDTLFQEGAARIRLPQRFDGTLEAVLVNTAGGLTGGDRLRWEAIAGPGTNLTVTTPANEKGYRVSEGHAEVTTRLAVGERAKLAWLPQETILYDGCHLVRRLDVELARDAELLVAEAVVVGRKAHGETVTAGHFADRWSVRVDGRLVHAEALRLGPDVQSGLSAAAMTGGARAFATVLAIAPDVDSLLDGVREIVGDCGGASFWSVAGTGKLLARIVAEDGYALRSRLVPLLRLLNRQAEMPRLWST